MCHNFLLTCTVCVVSGRAGWGKSSHPTSARVRPTDVLDVMRLCVLPVSSVLNFLQELTKVFGKNAVAAGSPGKKAKTSLPWLPTSYALPMNAIQETVMEHTATDFTQKILVGGVLFCALAAMYCLWARMGKPVPWSSSSSPSRRRSEMRAKGRGFRQ